MKGFSNELQTILHLLENYPLESYSELAKKIGVSTQTFSRRIEELKSKGIIREVRSSLRPESLQLERFIVIFLIDTVKKFELLEQACNIHPYTSSRNRIFATDYGLFTVFDIPSGSSQNLMTFLEALLKLEFCQTYFVFKSHGKRIFYPQPLQGNIKDIFDYDLESYLLQEHLEEDTVNLGREVISSSLELHPIQLLILRDITSDMRIPMSQLLDKYKNYLNLPEAEESFYSLPKGFRTYLEQFFTNERSENAIYIDFKKKYNQIIGSYIESYWLGVNRQYFEIYTRFSYLLQDIPADEKKRLFKLFNNDKPPFYIYIEDLGRDVVLTTSLPPFYQTKLSYFLKDRYANITTYLLDSFGYNAVKYRFYVHNYDLVNQKWKTDNKWMVETVLEDLENLILNNKRKNVENITK